MEPPKSLTDKDVYDHAIETKAMYNDTLSRLYARRDFYLHGNNNEKIQETIDEINALQLNEKALDKIISEYKPKC